MHEVVRETFFFRLWSRISRQFRSSVRELTPLEIDLQEQVYRLKSENRTLETENRMQKSEIAVLRNELKLMTEVHARDRKRVEAETAAYASQIKSTQMNNEGQ